MPMIVPEITPEPIRPPREEASASVETFGGGQGLENEGQELGKLSAQAGEIASFEKIRADQSAVEEAVGSKLSPAVTGILYDPKNGALARINQSTSMKDALKIHDDTLKQYNDIARKTASGLSGENQIGAFNKHAYTYGDSLNKTLMAHIDEHGKKLDQGSFTSFIDNTTRQAALGWGGLIRDPKQQAENLKMLDDHINQYAFRNGLGPDQVDEMKSKVNSNYHANIIYRMLADNQDKTANDYFNANKKDITNLEVRGDVEKNLETIPKQQQADAKKQEEEKYKLNERQALMDMLDGKLTLSEAQRRFRNDDIDKSTFNHLESKLSKPDIYEQSEISDPATFNQIRQAQLNKSNTPNEILRMISDGKSDKQLRPDDVQYLQKMTQDLPPSPRDKSIEAEANNLRDFGNRYFAETNFLGRATNQNKTKSEVDAMLSDFYRSVDGSKANGDQIRDIRNQVKKAAMQKRYPGLGNYDKAPDIVVNVKGQVIRVLNPDEKSGLKPKYKITPTESQRPDDE